MSSDDAGPKALVGDMLQSPVVLVADAEGVHQSETAWLAGGLEAITQSSQ